MFENFGNFFKKMVKPETAEEVESKEAAKERLQLVLMQDRANVSADFLELMKQEIIDVIKKYIEVDENAIDVRLTTQVNEDGTNGAPLLYANIPIVNIKNEMKVEKNKNSELQSTPKELVEEVEEVENEKEEKVEETPVLDEKVLKELNGEEETNQKEDESTSKEEIKLEESKDISNEEIESAEKDILKDIDDIDDLDFDEEEDDDVTFDDLLKAAEEAELAENNKKENNSKELEEKESENIEENTEESKDESKDKNKEEKKEKSKKKNSKKEKKNKK